ncbi:MAG: ferric reductase-like transmembrane domain-containing protein [Bryobacteraceae bacterium]|nr:ferric reductase-like transmembrane domain-containing protein [Bryobacteraceae bacterium]
MSVQYKAVYWNPAKRRYDVAIALGVLLFLGVFIGLTAARNPSATAETLVIRGTSLTAFFLLHVILSIGPLARLNTAFLPLLYNRRHLGVTMFLLALTHAVFAIVQFHALGDVNSLVSLLTTHAPFELFGLAALIVLFFMAATSHDFWLNALSPRVWKTLHMGVYFAYALLIAHVAFGALRAETNPALTAVCAMGAATVTGLHLAAGWRERRLDERTPESTAGLIEVGRALDIPEKRARIVSAGGERVAIFRYDGKISAISNVCQHQNGPLGEGRIVDGCVTCPWHGYQYLPESGASPPPFLEKVATYRTRVAGGVVYLDPRPCAPGTPVEPSRIE